MRRLALAIVLCLLVCGLGTSFAQAPDGTVDVEALVGNPDGSQRQGAELESATDDLANSLRCPKCQGLSVADSPSQSAREIRDEVKSLLAQGYSPDQVINYFVSTYGEFVRLEPTREGFNLFVWLAPILALALGLLAIVLWSRAEGARAQLEDELDDEMSRYRERVRQETS